MANLEIEEIVQEKKIDEFIQFEWQVYHSNPVWTPPIVHETKLFLGGKGLLFEHCRYRLFVAKEDSKIVARIAAFFDENLVKHWKQRVGLLGFFEAFPNRPRSVKALFEEGERFLCREGADTIWVPFNGGVGNSVGLLANAYNRPPVFLMSYNPSYYHQYLRRAGYQVCKELLAFTTDLLDSRLRRKVAYALRRAKNSLVRIRVFDKRRFCEESYLLARLYSETFKKHWGYAPLSEEEFFEMMEPFKLAIDPDFILFAEHNSVPVGFTLCVPDYNPLIKKLDGDLQFLNALAFLRLKKQIREARLIAIGVMPEWRGKGVAPLLVASLYNSMIRKGYITCEYSWVFRENISSQNVARKFGGDPYKRYLVYEKKFI